MPDGLSRAVFTALKPDGKVIFNPCEIQGNSFVYTLSPQTTAVSGLLSCQLRLYGENDLLLITPRFSLMVKPSVYSDDSIIESENEVGALTALVSESQEIIDEVRQNLSNGGFVPDFSVGSVETLPAGSMAEVVLSGTGEKPVLNFKIPQGPVGTNEELIPDTALSDSSTRPVQNRVIADALSKKLDKTEFGLSIENYLEKEDFNEAMSNFVELEEFGNELAKKQDKVSGKGLSANDFSDELKHKLEGIEEGANKFSLSDGMVTTSKIADYAISAAKLSNDAKSRALAVFLPAAGWSDLSQTVSVPAVTAGCNVIVAAAPACREAWADAEVYCSLQGNGTLTFSCGSVPKAELTANVVILV